MDVVSSTIMLITGRMSRKPNVVKYPVVSEFNQCNNVDLTTSRDEGVWRSWVSSCSVP
jgi:hypothetical protein